MSIFKIEYVLITLRVMIPRIAIPKSNVDLSHPTLKLTLVTLRGILLYRFNGFQASGFSLASIDQNPIPLIQS